METTHDGNLTDPSDRINRPLQAQCPEITDRPGGPALQLEVSETTFQLLARETRRKCWSPWSPLNADRPGATMEINEVTWLLWLDRAETQAATVDGQPHAAVQFDRIED